MSPSPRQMILPESVYHEAGHAVMHWATGRRFRYVTMRPRTHGHIGHLRGYSYLPRLRDVAACHDEMARRAAGRVAAARFAHREPMRDQLLIAIFSQAINAYRGDHDLAAFIEMGAGMDGEFFADLPEEQKGPQSWLPVWRTAESKIADSWPAVQAVACVLRVELTLQCSEVFDIADATMREREDPGQESA